MRLHPGSVVVLALFVASCESEPAAEGIPPAAPGDMRIETPELTIRAGEEKFWCFFGTFPDTVGVHGVTVYRGSDFTHHLLMKEVPDDAPFEDGELHDCLTLPDWWATASTFFESVGGKTREEEEAAQGQPHEDPNPFEPQEWARLPDGVSWIVEGGQRWVLDAHFLNVSDEDQTAVVAYDLQIVPADEVEHVAGTFNNDSGPFEVPPHSTWTKTFDCPWEQEATILSVGPHMHTYGTSFTMDVIRGEGGPPQRILDVPQWEPAFRDAAPGLNFDLGDLHVAPGDAFRTTCTWTNPNDTPITFPEEMCSTYGVGFDLPGNAFCADGPGGPANNPHM